jgi:hypothetical protein
MIIDHPYIKSAKIVTSYDDQLKADTNTLVVETTVELAKPYYETNDFRTHELMELLAQLRSFAENDFADYQAVEVHCPQKHYFARNLGHTSRASSFA